MRNYIFIPLLFWKWRDRAWTVLHNHLKMLANIFLFWLKSLCCTHVKSSRTPWMEDWCLGKTKAIWKFCEHPLLLKYGNWPCYLKFRENWYFLWIFMLINSIDHFLVFWLGLLLLLFGIEINFANILFHVFLSVYIFHFQKIP